MAVRKSPRKKVMKSSTKLKIKRGVTRAKRTGRRFRPKK